MSCTPFPYSFTDLVDFPDYAGVLESFSEAAGIPLGLMDAQIGLLLSEAGPVSVFRNFQRIHPVAATQCRESNFSMMKQWTEGSVTCERCQNGLIRYAAPIVIEGRHLASVFLGPVFHASPDPDFFRSLAKEFNFDETDYLEAVRSIPVIEEERSRSLTAGLSDLAHLLTARCLARLKEMELEQNFPGIRQKRTEYEHRLDMTPAVVFRADHRGGLKYVNRRFTDLFGYTGKEVSDMAALYQMVPQGPAKGTDHTGLTESVAKILGSGIKDSGLETGFTCKDGRMRHVRIHISVYSQHIIFNFKDITELKYLTDQLAVREQEYQTLAENSPDSIIRYDRDGRIRYLNSTLAQKLGIVSIKDVIGRHPMEIWPDGRYAKIDRAAVRAVKSGAVQIVEFAETRADGNLKYSRILVFPEQDVTGQTAGTIAFGLDVTEPRKTELQLKHFIDNLPGLAFSFRRSPDGHCSFPFTSSGIRELYGLDPEDVATDMSPIHDLTHPDDRPLIEDAIARSAQTLSLFSIESRICRPGHPERWVDCRSTPVREPDGGISWYGGIMLDITEKKQAEKELISNESRLRAIFEAIPDPMVIYDIKGFPTYVNPAFTHVFGWTLDELENKRIPFVPDSERQVSADTIEKIYRDRIPLCLETKRYTKNRGILDISLSAAVWEDREGNTLGMVVNLRDISEKKMLDAQLEQAQKIESLRTLAGGIAHDFNNYLSGLFGYIDLAREHARTPKVQDYLTRAIRSADRAKGLTHQLLTFSRGGAPVKEKSPLPGFLEETTRFALSGAKVSCSFDLEENLWICEYDRAQIGQVIDNLIINAKQAMPAGGNVHVAARNIEYSANGKSILAAGKYVRISVSDTGVGIPATHIKRIFDPFFTTKQTGSGLGLATSYSIVKQHGGIIDVESEPGNGAVFHVFLPAVNGTIMKNENSSEKRLRASGTILIMDDEEDIREMFAEMLELMGFSCVKTPDGQAAVDAFAAALDQDNPFRAVFLDFTVPGKMGGKEAVQKIRELDTDIPVFIASGYSEDKAIARPGEFGFTASLQKPFTIEQLTSLLNKYFS